MAVRPDASGSRSTTERTSLVGLALSEIEGILHGFDAVEASGALTPEELML
jgi:hypothetical protein